MITIDGNSLTIEQVIQVSRNKEKVKIHPKNKELVNKNAAVVEDFVKEGQVVYGITTGIGSFADVLIPREHVRELQKNLLMSHSSGTGPQVQDDSFASML